MGIKLMKYYKHIRDKMGLSGKMKLAVETKVPSSKAAMEKDSDDKIKLFREAIEKITGEKPPDF
ncbi:MAG: hypothetical protein ACLFQV_13595 [Vulcanimicrobiota bacterium]